LRYGCASMVVMCYDCVMYRAHLVLLCYHCVIIVL